MPDLEQLAARLVEAVKQVLPAAYDKAVGVPSELQASSDPSEWEGEARAASVAVLRELAESGQIAWAESLAGLADYIEKGAGDAIQRTQHG